MWEAACGRALSIWQRDNKGVDQVYNKHLPVQDIQISLGENARNSRAHLATLQRAHIQQGCHGGLPYYQGLVQNLYVQLHYSDQVEVVISYVQHVLGRKTKRKQTQNTHHFAAWPYITVAKLL